MLSVRKAQIEVFEQAALSRFEDEMVVHSKLFSPRLCEVIGDEQLRTALRQAMDRAATYHFSNRGPIRLYIEMMFLFGSDFDTDPQYPWAAEILRSPEEQMQRAEQLCAKVLDYQKRVSGPDAANTRRMLHEMRMVAEKPLTFLQADFAGRMRQEMTRVFPQKPPYIGDRGMKDLISKASAQATRYRLSEIQGGALMVRLMFAFGHGCANDPLYPWISRTLGDERIIEPAVRTERLQKKAVTWLDHVLAGLQDAGGRA